MSETGNRKACSESEIYEMPIKWNFCNFSHTPAPLTQREFFVSSMNLFKMKIFWQVVKQTVAASNNALTPDSDWPTSPILPPQFHCVWNFVCHQNILTLFQLHTFPMLCESPFGLSHNDTECLDWSPLHQLRTPDTDKT